MPLKALLLDAMSRIIALMCTAHLCEMTGDFAEVWVAVVVLQPLDIPGSDGVTALQSSVKCNRGRQTHDLACFGCLRALRLMTALEIIMLSISGLQFPC